MLSLYTPCILYSSQLLQIQWRKEKKKRISSEQDKEQHPKLISKVLQLIFSLKEAVQGYYILLTFNKEMKNLLSLWEDWLQLEIYFVLKFQENETSFNSFYPFHFVL